MTLENANRTVSIWGKYLEYCHGRLSMLFIPYGKIPESLLPFPKSILEDALNIMDKYYFEVGNKRGMELMRETMIILELYGDDFNSIQKAGEIYNNFGKRKQIVTALKDWQKTWLETQKDL